jgi:penicillin-binding protein 1C
MQTLTQPPDHYGLSLVLGGAEGTLWDITGMYASMARTLNHYFNYPGKNRYAKSDFHAPNYISVKEESTDEIHLEENSWMNASSIYLTFDALKELYRPGEETGWRYFTSSKKIAWKTGTSFGFRDGWAVGVTPQYAVGVWVGNADGEGRPGLTGTETAAPIMFDIFSQLSGNTWFREPLPEMERIAVCSKSGQRISSFCEKPDTLWVNRSGLETLACEYHKRVHLTPDQKYQVHADCQPIGKMHVTNWFVLNPVQEYYFKPRNLSYKTLPPFRDDCRNTESVLAMELVYPKPNARIFIPRELDGTPGGAVFELAHRNSSTAVYWHLDGEFIGTTRKIHQIELNPGEGKHVLTVLDESGAALERRFEVISKL